MATESQWKPKTEYATIDPCQAQCDSHVLMSDSLREAQSLVKYWERLVPSAPRRRIVKAVTTYTFVDE